MPDRIGSHRQIINFLMRSGHAEGFVASTRHCQLVEAYKSLTSEAEEHGTGAPEWCEATLVPDKDDLAGLLRIARRMVEFRSRHLASSYSAEPGDAIRDEDEENPGKYKIIFRTLEGVEHTYRNLSREMGEDLTERQRAHPRGGFASRPSKVGTPVDDWIVLRDGRTDPPSRLAALGRLLDTSRQEEAISYLVSELERPIVPSEWRDALIFALEDIHFPPSLRDAVADRLLFVASALRAEPEGREKVVWSALRRGASLLASQQVDRLLPFLDNGPVDTRAVALQALSRMFEPKPPEMPCPVVANRIYQFAAKFLDPDVFTPGESSLIARNAVSALAVVGDLRLQAAIDSAKALKRAFLTRRIRQELERIRSGWLERGVSCDHPAVGNIGDGLSLLTGPA